MKQEGRALRDIVVYFLAILGFITLLNIGLGASIDEVFGGIARALDWVGTAWDRAAER